MIWVFWNNQPTPVHDNLESMPVEEWIVHHGIPQYPGAIYFFWDGVTE